MTNKALIIIDMLNDFVTGTLKCERAALIIPNLKKLISAAHAHDVPVIFSNDAHYPQDAEVVNKWGEHAIKGTKGAGVIPELKPSKKDYIVEKRTYSSFYETGLEPLLRSMYGGKGADTLILCGLHTHICV
ncbi:MAG: cysteine hydrolase, partial [Candidatus Methanosuratus sp.]|nr:cysteine hydrolase [Candidatus Methanosuratincola sp.]